MNAGTTSVGFGDGGRLKTLPEFAESGAGAQGIAQFTPGTAQAYGLSNPFDPRQSIDAQAHLMRDLLRRFASVPLALAAYNAGPAPVAACGCVPQRRTLLNQQHQLQTPSQSELAPTVFHVRLPSVMQSW